MSRLLPYETIVQATNGEPEAVNAVLTHYAGYIRYYSHIYGHYNVDMEDYIKTKLIESLFKVSAKYSCGFPNTLVSSIIVGERYLDYFTTITEDRL